jgi:hypothetical protein
MPDFGTIFDSRQSATSETAKIQNEFANHFLGYHGVSCDVSFGVAPDGVTPRTLFSILSGSTWEFDGLMYMTDSNFDCIGTGWDVYVYFTPNFFSISESAPIWIPMKRGWYNDTSGTARAVFHCHTPREYPENAGSPAFIPLKDQHYFWPYIPAIDKYYNEYPAKGSDKTLVDYIVGNEKTVSLAEPGWYQAKMVGWGYGGGSGGSGGLVKASVTDGVYETGNDALSREGATSSIIKNASSLGSSAGLRGGKGGKDFYTPMSSVHNDGAAGGTYSRTGNNGNSGGGGGAGMSGKYIVIDFFIQRPESVRISASNTYPYAYVMGNSSGLYLDNRYGSYVSPYDSPTVGNTRGGNGQTGAAGRVSEFSDISYSQSEAATAGYAGETIGGSSQIITYYVGGAGGAGGAGLGAGGGGGGGGGGGEQKAQMDGFSITGYGGAGGRGAAGAVVIYKLT